MSLQSYIDGKNISRYQLAKLSGLPKSTVNDICIGKTEIENCSAKTVQKIAKALNCTMEDVLNLEEKGLPPEKGYMECGLPDFLESSIKNMQKSWELVDNGKEDLHWDLNWCELNADINSAEVNQIISTEQAWYLREKYLRMERV